jgi:hypothetical protein
MYGFFFQSVLFWMVQNEFYPLTSLRFETISRLPQCGIFDIRCNNNINFIISLLFFFNLITTIFRRLGLCELLYGHLSPSVLLCLLPSLRLTSPPKLYDFVRVHRNRIIHQWLFNTIPNPLQFTPHMNIVSDHVGYCVCINKF